MRELVSSSGFLAAAVALPCVTSPAVAEGLRLHGRAGAAFSATGHQRHEQGWGARGSAMMELPLARPLGVGVGVGMGLVTLSDGEPPRDPRFADPEGASGLTGSLGVRLRPLASASSSRESWTSRFWTGGNVGVISTNGLLRWMSEVSVGYDFALGSDGMLAGPSVGWLHVFQPDDSLRGADANLVSFGLHAMFASADPPPAPTEPRIAALRDSDADGVPDPTDACPVVAEDADGYQDADGCPDPDNDGDGRLDQQDRCPMQAEDLDELLDRDGCPETDADADGVPDEVDDCPLVAEDADGFKDADGCPEPDNDADGVADALDECPDEAETINGYADDDGCPDTQRVRVVGDRILLDERIHFLTNSWWIHERSHALLLRVATLLNDHPEYTHVEVQGHADARGTARFNQWLSERRAKAVVGFLTERGQVDASRLEALGYGTSKPLVRASHRRAWYMNRRVEFSVARGRPGEPKEANE